MILPVLSKDVVVEEDDEAEEEIVVYMDDEELAVDDNIPGLAQAQVLQYFFNLLFVKKIIYLIGGQINDPSSGRLLFSFIPFSNFLVSVSHTLLKCFLR